MYTPYHIDNLYKICFFTFNLNTLLLKGFCTGCVCEVLGHNALILFIYFNTFKYRHSVVVHYMYNINKIIDVFINGRMNEGACNSSL